LQSAALPLGHGAETKCLRVWARGHPLIIAAHTHTRHLENCAVDTTICTLADSRVLDDSAAIRIVPATPDDAPLVLRFIRLLAEYERLADKCVATEERVRETLFGDDPAAEVIFAYLGDEPVGFSLFFHNYSTFLARRGLFLEDLFVIPAARGKGVGHALLSALARIAIERDCGRLEWAVLNWNQLAIDFYRRIGAVPLDDWTAFRMTGDALSTLADRSTPST
jgi:GNAT superfamily N-acetyltransferase